VAELAAEAPQEEVPGSPVHGEGRAPAREVVSIRARASAQGYPDATRQHTFQGTNAGGSAHCVID